MNGLSLSPEQMRVGRNLAKRAEPRLACPHAGIPCRPSLCGRNVPREMSASVGSVAHKPTTNSGVSSWCIITMGQTTPTLSFVAVTTAGFTRWNKDPWIFILLLISFVFSLVTLLVLQRRRFITEKAKTKLRNNHHNHYNHYKPSSSMTEKSHNSRWLGWGLSSAGDPTNNRKASGDETNKSNSNNKNNTNTTNTNPNNNLPSRYETDLWQAHAMQSVQRNTTRGGRSNDVTLALQGIEQAEVHRERGELEAALKLYELSIELILQLLRQAEANGMVKVDRETLEAQAAAALSVAEDVKRSLQRVPPPTNQQLSPQQQEQQQQQNSISPPPPPAPALSLQEWSPLSFQNFQTLTQALISAIQGKPTTVPTKKEVTPKTRSQLHTNSSTSISNSTFSSMTRKPQPTNRTRPVAKKQGSTRNNNTTTTTLASASSPPTAKQAPNNNNSSNSSSSGHTELGQMVLSDFYVRLNTLQKTTWNDISGLATVKQSLQESAILPLMRPDLFSGLRKPQNILLWGPPGTGKTMLVRAAAHESKGSLFVVTAGTLTSKWMGEAEKLVRELFTMARELAPSIIFIDEVDSLLSKRKSDGEHEASRRLKTEVMVQMDGIAQTTTTTTTTATQTQGLVLVLACTNCPWDIDSAVLRRFPRRIYVPLPDEEARKGLIKSLLRKAGKHTLKASQVASLVKRTEGYSCSDIAAIASEASFGPLRTLDSLDDIRTVSESDLPPISMKDFVDALAQAAPSVTSLQIRMYEEWQQQASASSIS